MKRFIKHPQLLGTGPDKHDAKASGASVGDTDHPAAGSHNPPGLSAPARRWSLFHDSSNLDSQTQLILHDLFSEQCGKVLACTTIY